MGPANTRHEPEPDDLHAATAARERDGGRVRFGRPHGRRGSTSLLVISPAPGSRARSCHRRASPGRPGRQYPAERVVMAARAGRPGVVWCLQRWLSLANGSGRGYSSGTGRRGRWPGGRPRSGQIAADRTPVGAVQPAVLGAVPAVAVVLKLVAMPGDTRLLDRGVLVIIHVHTSLLPLIPLVPAP